MAMMKGSAFTARFAYLKRTFPSRWEELVAAFDAPTRALARGPCLKASWYPFSCFVDLNVKADQLVGKGDLALAREMGRDAAIANMPTLYRLFYKVGSPEYAFTKAANLWRQHHDSGRAELVPTGPGSAEWRLYDFAAPHPALCRSLEGFLTGSLEMIGVADIRVHEGVCVLHGAAYCGIMGSWKP
jgi:hypothetical protein